MAEKDIKLCFVYVALKSFGVNDVAIVLTDCKYLVLIVNHFLRTPIKEGKCFDMSLYKCICGKWFFLP